MSSLSSVVSDANVRHSMASCMPPYQYTIPTLSTLLYTIVSSFRA